MFAEGGYYFFQDTNINVSVSSEWSVTAFD